jgi:hypothetical protein
MSRLAVPDQTTQHLFAVLQGKEEVRRIPLQQSLQEAIGGLFASQTEAFRSTEEEVLAFDPSLRPAEDQIIRIGSFHLPDQIREALSNPMGVTPIAFSAESTDRIVGLFVGDLQPAVRVRFQAFSRRQMLTTSGLSIILSGNTFRRLEEPGLILDNRLCAVVEGTDLFIRTYAAAARVLDLTNYYREATDDEIDEFIGNDRLHCDDVAGLKAAADTWTRRKVAILLKSGVLASVSARRAKEIGAEFKVAITLRKTGGKERIALPTSRRELKDLLRFLDEDYYKSPLTKTRYLSHSKQKLPPAIS